jgi:alkanesulfonate monooxygenase SsuD/methylene tetrahydromethanopterin reductase-like flavin-dependent oxidoreductase (luciferase family)
MFIRLLVAPLDKPPRQALALWERGPGCGPAARGENDAPREEAFQMARNVTIGINWQGRVDFKALIERAKLADQAGVHSIWVAEAWGHDAFTLLTLMAEHTTKAQLATSIVNTYSRTPAALAQHFGTLDTLSGGRMIAGLGTSGPNVIEHFHGIKFNPPLTRMREYVEIINLLMAGTPLNYSGKIFKLGRGFTLRFEPQRKHIPIFLASLNRKSVEYTARAADGWMPVMIPLSGLKGSVAEFRSMVSAAGRHPEAVAVKAPGTVHVTADVARARAGHAGTLAFYAARMGTFYAEQLTRFGFGNEINRIREAWAAGGATAGTEAVEAKLLNEIGYVGDVNGAVERLTAQEEAGIDLHPVEVDTGPDTRAFERTLQTLIG